MVWIVILFEVTAVIAGVAMYAGVLEDREIGKLNNYRRAEAIGRARAKTQGGRYFVVLSVRQSLNY